MPERINANASPDLIVIVSPRNKKPQKIPKMGSKKLHCAVNIAPFFWSM